MQKYWEVGVILPLYKKQHKTAGVTDSNFVNANTETM